MTKISQEDVRKLAHLARLSLSDEEVEKYTKEIVAIFGYIDKLQSVDTSGLEPTYQVSGLDSVTRADEVLSYGTSTESLLKNAPDSQKNLFKVRRMIG